MTTKAQKEIAHEKLDGNEDKKSARYLKLGTEQQMQLNDSAGSVKSIPFVLMDKVVYEINVCPHCDSKATFHRRIQESGDVVGNVWRAEQSGDENGFQFRKMDYCLDCHREFMVELYVWKRKQH